MSEGPLFPKKTDPAGQEESPPVVIERTDEPNPGTTGGAGWRACSYSARQAALALRWRAGFS